jgi:hypothetical protein
MAGDGSASGEHGGFLPPQPSGAEPDLSARPQAAPPTTSHGYAAPAGAAPTPQQQMGWGAPPQPPPGYGPPPGPPSPGWQQPQQQWGWQPQPQPLRYPDNGAAVAGFSLSMTSAGLLLFSAGLSSIVSVICAGFGIFYSRRGKQKVDRGETPVNRGLAQAGYVIGIIAMVLSVLATAAWVVFAAIYATDDSFRHDFNNDNNGDGFETTARLAAVAFRVVATLVR